ncbi:MAG: flagellar basal body protein FliL [Spirochaetaceae bacterium]|nr:flagellar basal body protein FliL [Spirochaetaceae bacterium]
MTTVRSKKHKPRPAPELFLLGILIALLAAIALGTAWALFVRPVPASISGRKAPDTAAPTADGGESKPGQRIFMGMGRLRVRLAGPAGGNAAVVITIVFPYDDTDRAFVEELSLNVNKFRSLTVDYFEAIRADSPVLTDEQALKQNLLSRYNSLLRLGKIETLYFSEFMIIN